MTDASKACFAQTLRAARIRAGLTQVAVAANIGVTQATVSQWEAGTVEPTLANLRRIAAVLALDLVEAHVGRGEDHLRLALRVGDHVRDRLRVRARLQVIARGRLPVVLGGPTGTGKTLMCETLSRTLDVPFVTAEAYARVALKMSQR